MNYYFWLSLGLDDIFFLYNLKWGMSKKYFFSMKDGEF